MTFPEDTCAAGTGDVEQLLRRRAELSRLVEPGDALAGLLIGHLGAEDAHRLIQSDSRPGARLRTELAVQGEAAGLGRRQRDLAEGLARWRTRRGQADGARDLGTIRRAGGGLVVPEDPRWPRELDDLGGAAPVALWHRSTGGDRAEGLARLPHVARRAAVVGSREVTDYGLRVTAELVEDLVGHGVCVVSGGAYGVDAAAHRAALRRHEAMTGSRPGAPAAGGAAAGAGGARQPRPAPTVAVLAGGLDRFYPAGNEPLLRSLGDSGLLLSEMPPGGSPTRHRFLQRNRLIAALTAVTVVVEARWRSGAQNTAHHALALGRPVGAVPGSVHSPSSAGCHRLLRETPAELVTDAADVVELIAGLSGALGTGEAGSSVGGGVQTEQLPLPSGGARPDVVDGLSQADRLLFDALPLRRLSAPGKVSEVAGLPMSQVLAGLTRLQRRGLARESGGHWGRSLGSQPGG
ncbi:DNA-processing protein DprA [Nesterenkonia sp. HG001]|uniref:DNA-processing protein DprA n=1 Tax=Nesterenkonia sp. HG001 TaxID=2983207 RepID=UPI002AC72F5A|nr:DNA-processing protein DprA [Nesterenkonia sp. HG001]MDZ5078503.1 DNA-protecting protein DprA [Nesterenkonia sp. HG001]